MKEKQETRTPKVVGSVPQLPITTAHMLACILQLRGWISRIQGPEVSCEAHSTLLTLSIHWLHTRKGVQAATQARTLLPVGCLLPHLPGLPWGLAERPDNVLSG